MKVRKKNGQGYLIIKMPFNWSAQVNCFKKEKVRKIQYVSMKKSFIVFYYAFSVYYTEKKDQFDYYENQSSSVEFLYYQDGFHWPLIIG